MKRSNFTFPRAPLLAQVTVTLILTLIAFAGPARADGSSFSYPFRDKWALVLGISKFSVPNSNLPYAAKDARDFAGYLVNEAGYARDHVSLLTDEHATA